MFIVCKIVCYICDCNFKFKYYGRIKNCCWVGGCEVVR